MKRGAIAAVAAGLIVVAVGCGQTDYATDVTADSAQLNGTITSVTENVVTTAWFEYWPTASPSDTARTPDQNVTSTGPIHADLGDLDNHTEYRYRLCATEDDSQAVCAQTREFTTGRVTVQAYGETEHTPPNGPGSHYISDLDFDLVQGSSDVTGPAFVIAHYSGGFGTLTFPLGSHTAPDITCFSVTGNHAVIGLFDTDGTYSLQSHVELVDGGPLGSGQDTAAVHLSDVGGNSHRDPTDCSPLSYSLPLKAGEIVINDAP
jgi:hypothetical protein